jgi:hypothetical protein
MHFRIIALLLAIPCAVLAEDAGQATDPPDVVAKIAAGLNHSGIAQLTSHTSEDDGTTYHLKTLDYLGTIERDGNRYPVAALQFIRSSVGNTGYPPARGHGFLAIFDHTFKVISYGPLYFGDYHMEGNVLYSGKTLLADFDTTDPSVRTFGWMLDSTRTPYPFPDKISEEDWESGAFLKKDLSSPRQEIREKAAEIIRASFKPTPLSRWEPLVEQLKEGMPKEEVIRKLGPHNVLTLGSGGSGSTHTTSYRLDDQFTLTCAYHNKGNILFTRTLHRAPEIKDVSPPANYTGQWTTFYIDGNPRETVLLLRGKRIGPATVFFPDGSKQTRTRPATKFERPRAAN